MCDKRRNGRVNRPERTKSGQDTRGDKAGAAWAYWPGPRRSGVCHPFFCGSCHAESRCGTARCMRRDSLKERRKKQAGEGGREGVADSIEEGHGRCVVRRHATTLNNTCVRGRSWHSGCAQQDRSLQCPSPRTAGGNRPRTAQIRRHHVCPVKPRQRWPCLQCFGHDDEVGLF